MVRRRRWSKRTKSTKVNKRRYVVEETSNNNLAFETETNLSDITISNIKTEAEIKLEPINDDALETTTIYDYGLDIKEENLSSQSRDRRRRDSIDESEYSYYLPLTNEDTSRFAINPNDNDQEYDYYSNYNNSQEYNYYSNCNGQEYNYYSNNFNNCSENNMDNVDIVKIESITVVDPNSRHEDDASDCSHRRQSADSSSTNQDQNQFNGVMTLFFTFCRNFCKPTKPRKRRKSIFSRPKKKKHAINNNNKQNSFSSYFILDDTVNRTESYRDESARSVLVSTENRKETCDSTNTPVTKEKHTDQSCETLKKCVAKKKTTSTNLSKRKSISKKQLTSKSNKLNTTVNLNDRSYIKLLFKDNKVHPANVTVKVENVTNYLHSSNKYCEFCNILFTDHDKLVDHHIFDHVGNLRCTFCNTRFMKKENLALHFKIMHRNIRLGSYELYDKAKVKVRKKRNKDLDVPKCKYFFQCSTCEGTFKLITSIKTHLNEKCSSLSRYTYIKCYRCGFLFSRRSFYFHDRWHDANKDIANEDIRVVHFSETKYDLKVIKKEIFDYKIKILKNSVNIKRR